MIKRFLQIAVLAGALLTTVGCGRLKDSNLANNPTTSTSKQKSYQTTSTSKNGYTVLLKNGQYVTSPITGLSATINDNTIDTRALQKGLVDLSKNKFSTNRYVFQEGQVLDTGTVTDWLARKSKDNPTGLNPAQASKKSKKYNPYILEEILEQDYLTGSGSNYHLGGVSIALALNSQDYYQKKKDGPQTQVDIDRATQESFGKQAADLVVKRLRKKKGMKNIPIMVALFSKTGKDSLVGGNYFSYGVADNNSSRIGNWKAISQKTQVLPTVGNQKAINGNDASAFNNFKTAVQGYFPDISGVIASVHYSDGKLDQENIQITTQFFGYTQVESFSRLVLSAAKKYLPSNVPIEIKISSVQNIQALVAKNTADDSYYVHVFGGE